MSSTMDFTMYSGNTCSMPMYYYTGIPAMKGMCTMTTYDDDMMDDMMDDGMGVWGYQEMSCTM
jgi:hypothetical protein